MKQHRFKLLVTSFAGVFASVATTFIIAYGFFKLAGPVPISVSQTTVEKKDTFEVTGEGQVIAVPNIAQFSLGIREESRSVVSAQKQADESIKKIKQQLEQFGVSQADIQTTNYQVYPRYRYEEGQRQLTGYVVNASLKVKMKEFDKINQAVNQAASLGINQVSQLIFTVDDQTLKELKNQARKKAIDNAKQKAKFLAENVGVNLGKIINLREEATTPTAPQYLGGPVKLESVDTVNQEEVQIKPGDAELMVKVTLTYEIR